MTRKEFLNIGFWITDFIRFKRGHSTEYNESVHLFSKRTGKQLNIFWDNYETITVAIYDTKEPKEFKKNTLIIEGMKNITEKQIEELYEKYLH
ncbi:MAG: hypothetical protein ACRCR9_00130 [Chitinophagaceae bacterium]